MSVSKLIEDAVTELLARELEKRGVKALPKVVYTPYGPRKPDLVCENSGIYLIEAKFSERNLIEAIAKVQNDYLRFYDLLGIKGGFALLHPEELTRPMPIEVAKGLAYRLKFKVVAMFTPKDIRKSFHVYEGTLSEIADILTRQILTPPEYVEPSIDYMIKSLRDATTYLVSGLTYLSGKQLEDIFGGKHVFQNILQYEEKEYPIENMRLASAYLLINQLLFYQVLARIRPDLFPEIDVDKIQHPSDLNSYFRHVLDINYQTVFSYDVVSKIPQSFTNVIKTLINVIQGLSPEKIRGDLLGTIFHDLIPFDVRKAVAAFYTNIPITELLAHLAIDAYDAKVADFAVGSGGLLVAAYRRKRELLEKERPFTSEDHRKFVKEGLLGIDVMPFAANIAACHLSLQSPEYFTNKVNIAVWDSTELSPNRVIPSIGELKMILTGQTDLEMFIKPGPEIKGVISLRREKSEEIKLGTYDVVIMNPPFTRQERLPPAYKKLLFDRFKDYRDYLHGQLGYYGYFILLADRFAREGGRIALVLPATVLRVKSCKGIRELWAKNYHVEYIITTLHRSAFSESAKFREILLIAKKVRPDPDAKTIVSIIKTLPTTLKEAKEMAEVLKNSERDWEDCRLAIKVHSYSKLREDVDNWFKYIATIDLSLVDIAQKLLASEKLTRFRAEVVRGIETARGGKIQPLTIIRPERAIKQSDEWVIEEEREDKIRAHNRFTHIKVEIPFSALQPALRRIALVNKMDITSITDYVVTDEFCGLKEFISGTLRKFKPPTGFWSIWKNYVNERIGQLVLVRRVDLSAPGTSLLAFYSQKPVTPPGVAWLIKTTSDDEAKILSLWFNSTINILQILLNRKETRGAFMQIDEYVLKEFKIPDLRKFSEGELKTLLEIFEFVKDIEFTNILHQLKTRHQAREMIDKAFLRILGYEDNVDILLEKLHTSLVHEIEVLKKLMMEGA